jgi:hypothetical protein
VSARETHSICIPDAECTTAAGAGGTHDYLILGAETYSGDTYRATVAPSWCTARDKLAEGADCSAADDLDRCDELHQCAVDVVMADSDVPKWNICVPSDASGPHGADYCDASGANLGSGRAAGAELYIPAAATYAIGVASGFYTSTTNGGGPCTASNRLVQDEDCTDSLTPGDEQSTRCGDNLMCAANIRLTTAELDLTARDQCIPRVA